MASSDSQIDKPQCGCPKRAELPDVNINRRAKHYTERASLYDIVLSNGSFFVLRYVLISSLSSADFLQPKSFLSLVVCDLHLLCNNRDWLLDVHNHSLN